VTSGSPQDPELAADLQRALDVDQFYLVYQPEIDLHTNGFAGVEALLRWRHPTRGVLSPADFLELLESSGNIVRVGRWTLDAACAQGAEWHARGYRFPVAVNTSLTQLCDADFGDDVDRCLRVSRFDPSHLTLEFSHTVLTDPEVLAHLRGLRDRGVHLAIDDFAPDHPRLDQLRDWPVDIVKLDRAFIAAAAHTPEGTATFHRLVHDARALRLRVIASGVEDASQRDQLRDEQVDVGQGFHFARPYDVDEIDHFLEDFALFSGRPL
jgi:EAL domain-containing protein (putative c-di-GMP-specific phosphodiesterase class I)